MQLRPCVGRGCKVRLCSSHGWVSREPACVLSWHCWHCPMQHTCPCISLSVFTTRNTLLQQPCVFASPKQNTGAHMGTVCQHTHPKNPLSTAAGHCTATNRNQASHRSCGQTAGIQPLPTKAPGHCCRGSQVATAAGILLLLFHWVRARPDCLFRSHTRLIGHTHSH